MYKNGIKIILDFLVAIIAIIVFSPLFILISILLFIANKGSIFFVQDRPGKNEVIFKIIKFKTMNDKRDLEGILLSDSQRLTPIGKFMRSFSLDEFPQLINVVKGEMSIVGPRPLLPEYLVLYNDLQKKRHQVKPGITGWAQVNGRNVISWDKKLELDVYYVNRISCALDFQILLLSLKKVFLRSDINNMNSLENEPFKGSNNI